jgi:hypothetical protein
MLSFKQYYRLHSPKDDKNISSVETDFPTLESLEGMRVLYNERTYIVHVDNRIEPDIKSLPDHPAGTY